MIMDDAYWMREAYAVAYTNSDDENTWNGAALVSSAGKFIASGANVIPSGVAKTEARLSAPSKYDFTVHAEANSIAGAAVSGKSTLGCTLYCPYSACAQCAGLIVQAGIVRVVSDERLMQRAPDRWLQSILHGNQIVPLGGVVHLFDGEKWNP